MRANTDKLMTEWEEHMKEFVPSDIINFEIAPREMDVLCDAWEIC